MQLLGIPRTRGGAVTGPIPSQPRSRLCAPPILISFPVFPGTSSGSGCGCRGTRSASPTACWGCRSRRAPGGPRADPKHPKTPHEDPPSSPRGLFIISVIIKGVFIVLLLILSPCLGMKRVLPLPSPLKKWNFKLVWSWGRDFSSYFPPTFQGKKGSVPKLIYFCFFSPYLFLSHRVFGWFCSLLTLICQCCLVFFNLIYSIFVYLLRGIKGCVRFGREKKGEIKKKKPQMLFFPLFFRDLWGFSWGFE